MYAQNVIKLFVMVLGGNSTSLNWWRCVKGSSYKIDLDLEIQGKIDFIACIFYLYTGGDKSFNGSMGAQLNRVILEKDASKLSFGARFICDVLTSCCFT